MREVVVVGGGAAGFFGALACAEAARGCRVVVLEQSNKVLGKVRISGGGRCNVTHDCHRLSQLTGYYPRGGTFLKPVLKRFMPADTVRWFETRGVRLKTEADGRVFPTTDSSETIIDCLVREARRLGVEVRLRATVAQLLPLADGRWRIVQQDGNTLEADAVLVATGGSPSDRHYAWLARLGLGLVEPVPSLFTFNLPDSPFEGLAGISVPDAVVRIAGTEIRARGPVLFTHWGISGPAVLKASALGARLLAERNYTTACALNLVPEVPDAEVRAAFDHLRVSHPVKGVANTPSYELPRRLWQRCTELGGISLQTRWGELPRKQANKLADWLLNAQLHMQGKTTFKEEFVTAGGVDLAELTPQTLESHRHPGLYFAGELLDIDGLTGGFNFQAAWATGWVAGRALAQRLSE
jgi:predicted Rossmann fold flavoprotein